MKILYEIVDGHDSIYSVLTSRSRSKLHTEMKLSYETWKNARGNTAMTLIYVKPVNEQQQRSLDRFLRKIKSVSRSMTEIESLDIDTIMLDKEDFLIKNHNLKEFL